MTTITNYNEHLLIPHTPKHHYTFLHTVYPYPHPHLPTHQDTPNYTAHASSLSCFILTTKPRNEKSLCAYQNLTLIYNTTRHPSPINQPRPIPYSYTLTHLKTTQSTDLNNHVQLKPSLSHYPYRHTATVLHTLETSTTGFKTTPALQAYCTSYSH